MTIKKVEIVQNPEAPVPMKILAESIVRLDIAVKAMFKSGLNQKAIVLLLQSLSGENQRAVKNILWALDNVKKEFLVEAKKG